MAAGVKVIENFVARFYLSNAGVTQLNLRTKSLQTQNIQKEYLNRVTILILEVWAQSILRWMNDPGMFRIVNFWNNKLKGWNNFPLG